MTKLTRIEEVADYITGFGCGVKASWDGCGSCEGLKGANKCRGALEIAKQICQLIPQPLDDKGLKKRIDEILAEYALGTIAGTLHRLEHPRSIKQTRWEILALLQPKIEEAVIQARKEQMVIDWAQAGKDVEEAKKQAYQKGRYDALEDNTKPMMEEAKREGIIELGKRLQQVRDESYDEQTFCADLNELTEHSLHGKVLPQVVIECVGVIFKNPKFNPEYAKPHQYEHSEGYPKNKHICVCGLEKANKMHTALILH